MTPWALVSIWLALVVIPELDDPLKLGSKMLRDKISKHLMERLKCTATASGGGVSSTELASADCGLCSLR